MTAGTEILIIGAGAFGTALAVIASNAGNRVRVWCRDPEQAHALQTSRNNAKYLPGIALPEGIGMTADPASASAADIILCAVPAQMTGSVLKAFAPHIKPGSVVVACAKGVEQTSGRLQTEIIMEEIGGGQAAALSGPGFAAEIARGLPTAVTAAASDISLAEQVCGVLSTRTFRPYATSDLVGVEIGGAVKNILAIGAGVVIGRRLGEGARAALIARGLAEMIRFGTAQGAKAGTFGGLSGLGDLVLTATSTQSRNMTLGIALGEGKEPDALTSQGRPLAEGAFTAPIVASLAREQDIDMPITQAVADALDRTITIDQAIQRLLERPLRREQA